MTNYFSFLLLIYLIVKITQFQHLAVQGWSSSEHQPYWSGGHWTVCYHVDFGSSDESWFAQYRIESIRAILCKPFNCI